LLREPDWTGNELPVGGWGNWGAVFNSVRFFRAARDIKNQTAVTGLLTNPFGAGTEIGPGRGAFGSGFRGPMGP